MKAILVALLIGGQAASAVAQVPGTCHLMPVPNEHSLLCVDVTGSRVYEFTGTPLEVPPPMLVPAPTPVVAPAVPLLASVDVAGILARLAAIDAHITAVDVKFDAYEHEPPWLQKVFTNPWVVGVIGAATSYYVGHQVAK